MGSTLNNAPLVQDIDAVGVLDSRKAVKEICNFKDFLLMLNENQRVLGHGPCLQAIHLVIGSSQGQEFLMGSTLDNAPLVQNIDTVGVLDGRKAVSNGNGCSSLSHLSQ